MNTTKKRLVTNLNNLTIEQQEALKALYPTGYTDAMMRIDKPNGDFFYVVPFETEEIFYLVKIDVKVDGKALDDKDLFGDDEEGIKDDERIADESVEALEISDDE